MTRLLNHYSLSRMSVGSKDFGKHVGIRKHWITSKKHFIEQLKLGFEASQTLDTTNCHFQLSLIIFQALFKGVQGVPHPMLSRIFIEARDISRYLESGWNLRCVRAH